MIHAEIITIGEELLIGQVIDTNSAWISEQLNLIGISVKQITSISDNKEQIIDTLKNAIKRSKIILITGGLGPTKDDITKQTLADFFDSKLIFNEDAFKNIEAIFKRRNLQVSELNKLQAYLPDNCKVIPNIEGTASGMLFRKDECIIISMPGVPYEMKTMMEKFILKELQNEFNLPYVVHKTILTQGIGESFLAEKIEKWENNLPSNISLAYLPSPGIVRLRLSAKGEEKEKLNELISLKIDELKEIISEYIFGYDNDTLEEIVGKLLKEKNKTLAIAESCTGGYLSHLITSVPGSSNYFKGSIISYANEIKMHELNVDEETLKRYGAVSKEVVEQMAKNILLKFNTDFAIATSGIAGPDGGTKDKPVGMVWIAVADKKSINAQVFYMGEHRGRNIQKSAISALNLLRKKILE
ncbi:MAG: competence/damage-inducible protein A [Bacteroidia bacterium]